MADADHVIGLAAAERERLALRLAECADTAFTRLGLVQRSFRIGAHPFVLRFAGQDLAGHMCRALEHLAVAPVATAALTIDCWSAEQAGVDCPQPRWPASFFFSRGEIRGLDGPEMRIAWFQWLKLLNVYFPKSARAYYCLASHDPFPVQQFGSPALTIFSWWFATLGWQFTHAAVVGNARGGVLVAGLGGAGKSTLAFSTIGSDLCYVSDDYCVLVPGTPPQALALYNSGKLTERSLSLLPHLRGQAANAHDAQREKAVFFLREKFPGRHLAQTSLRAVVLSHLSSGAPALEPISSAEVFQIAAHSTLVQLAGSAHPDLMRLKKILHGLPAYRLRHGTDIPAAHRLLLRLCES